MPRYGNNARGVRKMIADDKAEAHVQRTHAKVCGCGYPPHVGRCQPKLMPSTPQQAICEKHGIPESVEFAEQAEMLKSVCPICGDDPGFYIDGQPFCVLCNSQYCNVLREGPNTSKLPPINGALVWAFWCGLVEAALGIIWLIWRLM